LIDAIDDVLRTTVSLVRDIPERDADLPTGCPAWTVRDQVAHMAGLEQVLGGAPQPGIDLPPLDHVGTDFDAYMERQVHVRRQLPLSAIADELDGLRRRRSSQLRAAAEQGDPPVPGPFGDRPLSQSLPIRVFDLWAHEQDIRRAVGLPVRERCDAAAIALGRAILGWSTGLPKQLADLSADVTIRVTGPERSETTFRIGDGGPAALIEGDLGDLTAAFCGRTTAPDDLVSGDPDVVAALAGRLAMTP
jgi:uncharacterized protein (TIGR03083 family)